METSDMCLAAYLLSRGGKLNEVKMIGQTALFIFDKINDEEFWKGEARVEPRHFYYKLLEVRARINEQKPNKKSYL